MPPGDQRGFREKIGYRSGDVGGGCPEAIGQAHQGALHIERLREIEGGNQPYAFAETLKNAVQGLGDQKGDIGPRLGQQRQIAAHVKGIA